MSLTIKWDITYKCNLNCKHCINGELLGHIDNEIDLEQFESIIQNITSIYSVDYIHLLGGEPTVRKDFLEICSIFEKYDINFGFNTNSLLLNKTICEQLVSNKAISNIVFSIEGPNPEINDEIRGRKVFNHISEAIDRMNKIRKLSNNSKLKLSVNIVLSKKNKGYIREMIDFCIEKNIDRFNILSLIEKGNALESGLSLSFNEELEVIESIAKCHNEIKDKIVIVPKFTRPLAIDYAKEVLNLPFPEINHGCGAGMTFAYLNNVGELYPCDRCKEMKEFDEKDNYNILKNEFDTVWNLESFSKPFRLMEADEYKDREPCNKCIYFMKDCFPCCIDSIESNSIKTCFKFLDLIYEARYSKIKPSNHAIRISNLINGNKTFFNTKTLKTIELNESSALLLEEILKGNIYSYGELERFAVLNEIDKFDLIELIKFLGNREFIIFGDTVETR